MNTITTNPGLRPAATQGVDEANAAAVLVPLPAPYQPYVFVDGEPPPDNAVLPRSAYSAGLPAPTYTGSLTGTSLNGLSESLEAMIKNGPATSADALTNANITAMQDDVIRMLMKSRTSSLETRDKELVLSREKKLIAIDKGLEAAKLELAAGIATGVGQIAAGAFSVVGGFKGEGVNGSGVATGKYSGFGSMINGIATIAGSTMTYAAAVVKREQQLAELDAEQASIRMNQNNDFASSQREALLAFVQGQKDTLQTQVDSNKRIFV